MATVYIGLGTNLGNREANLDLAMKLFRPEFQIRRVAPVYETDPLYRPGLPQFWNTVCCVETSLTPEQAQEKCRQIERAMGRRKSQPFDPRVIDVQILLYDSIVLRTSTLTIPHPRMHERAFVLAPLSRIAGEVVHPVFGRTINSLLQSLGRFSHKIVKIDQSV